MDHPCFKCGHIVEDGKPFCSQCGGPQIRVKIAEAAPAAVAGDLPSEELSLGELPSAPDALNLNLLPIPTSIRWPIAWRSCGIAAMIAALIMALGLMVPLLAVFGAGFLAVNLYHRRNAAWTVDAKTGALLGAICGMIFFALAAVFETLAVTLLHTGGQVREKMMEAMHQAAARSSDPQVQAAFDRLTSPDGIALMFTFGLLALLVVSIAAGSVAGALTGAVLGRNNRR